MNVPSVGIHKWDWGGWPEAFDLAGMTYSGCPVLRRFAEREHERTRNTVCVEGTKRCVGSIATHPFDKLKAASCKRRKDGTPSAQMAHANTVEAGSTVACSAVSLESLADSQIECI